MSTVKSLSEKLMIPNSQPYKDAYRILELFQRLDDSITCTDEDVAVQAALNVVYGSMEQFVAEYVFGEEDI